jgi:TolA-binding protein
MLKPKKRVTRQQIKEDKLVTFAAKASDFYDRYSRNIIAGAGILVVLVVVVVFYVNSRAQVEKDATFELSMAKIEIGQGNLDAAESKLIHLIDTYGGTPSGGDATFFLGNVQLFQANWNGAIQSFQQYIDRFGRDPMMTSAAVAGIGLAYENMGELDKAAEYYSKAAADYPHEFNAPQYLMDAGRCYGLGGDSDRARETYNVVIELYEDSPLSGKAEDELSRL